MTEDISETQVNGGDHFTTAGKCCFSNAIDSKFADEPELTNRELFATNSKQPQKPAHSNHWLGEGRPASAN